MDANQKIEESRLFDLRSLDVISVMFERIGRMGAALSIVCLGVLFIVVAYHADMLLGKDCDPATPTLRDCGHGYLLNVSWSLTMLIVFPAIFYVITAFYDDIYSSLDDLADSLGTSRKKVRVSVERRLTSRKMMTPFLLTPFLWYLYFDSLIESPTWVWQAFTAPCHAAVDCNVIVEAVRSITSLGIITTFTQLVLGMSIIFLVRVVALGLSISELLSGETYLEVYAHDNHYGVATLRRQTRRVLVVLTLQSIYILSYVVDKTVIQGELAQGLPIAATYTAAWVLFGYYVHRKLIAPIDAVIRRSKRAEVKRYVEEIRRLKDEGVALDKINEIDKAREKYAEKPETLLTLRPRSVIAFTFFQFLPLLTSIYSFGATFFSKTS